ncbi:hypothetical protein B0I72DRAFT_133210 [Yarrowia lipolytica]|uniref:Vacuolar protein sorting-associated protein 62 n=1 Tax=Yarrowia lipolytica TaxID=4952 RepID=A0A371CCP3_YARLL|nr:hypothetical protein B0I71DRAFT_128559 [Yarrowia lipolytica]RDW35315.1 hypothetical protein B0I72DRAFT_133210 [Yarrowia lipolytica]
MKIAWLLFTAATFVEGVSRHKRDPVWTVNPGQVPDYVLRHCPGVHLYSEEKYLPGDPADYVTNFKIDTASGKTVLNGSESDPVTLARLGQYSFEKHSSRTFMTSLTDFNADPDWITGEGNIPHLVSGKIDHAKSVLIVVDKGDGLVDAFWFYFYPFNLGPFVMGGGPYGNHVGDWEHSLVRFQDGVPQILWMSAHGGGNAYYYNAAEKMDNDPERRVLFSARGTHANYGSVGQHSHDLPFYMLSDFTDRGALWDPVQKYYGYTLTHRERGRTGADRIWFDGRVLTSDGQSPHPSWLNYLGRWGDRQLPNSDPRQKWHPFNWRYIDGPRGPMAKNLLRHTVCERNKWWNLFRTCRIRRRVETAEGIEAEGYGCVGLMDWLPWWIGWIPWTVTWRGYGCWAIDRLWG